MSLTPIELRHTLHKNPELAFNETKTTKLLIDNIKGLKFIHLTKQDYWLNIKRMIVVTFYSVQTLMLFRLKKKMRSNSNL